MQLKTFRSLQGWALRNRCLVVGRGYAVDRTDLDRFIEKQKIGVLV